MKFKTFKKCTKNVQKRKALLALRAFLEKFRIEVVYCILIVLLFLKINAGVMYGYRLSLLSLLQTLLLTLV